MDIQVVSLQDFKASQEQFPTANFLQSGQMLEVGLKRQNFLQQFPLHFLDQGQLVGAAILGIRKRYRFFKEAVMLQGPLWLGQDPQQMVQMIQTLEGWLKQKGVSRLVFNPYLVDRVLDESLQTVQENLGADLIQSLKAIGYQHHKVLEDSSQGYIGQIFRKDLRDYPDKEAIYKDFSNNLKSRLRKFEESAIVIKEIQAQDLNAYYQILKETAARKHFSIQGPEYFQYMKESFGPANKYMIAYLDCQAYRAYYQERIQYFEDRIKELEAGVMSKKHKGLIRDAQDQMRSYYKRKADFEGLNIQEDLLPLSGYQFMAYGPEVVSLHGGSYEEYMNMGGSTLLYWHMIQWAKDQGFDYLNFYGTIETQSASQNDGNFNFKRQFGGHLEQMVGVFSKTYSPVLKLVEKIKPIQ